MYHVKGVFTMQKLYFGMAFKGTCRYFFEKLAILDVSIHKDTLSAKKSFEKNC